MVAPVKYPLLRILWWLKVAPLGKPVVPLVYWILIASSTSRSSWRVSNSLSSIFFDKFKKTPQFLQNINVKDKNIINKPEVKKSIKIAEKLIKGNGRILVRKSGTESKIRIMVESENKIILSKCVNIISKKIK